MYCNRCGAEVTPGAAFCSKCGAPLAQESGWQQNNAPQQNYTQQNYTQQNYTPQQGYGIQAEPFSMKWHKALIYCFLFLTALASVGNAIMVFTGSHYEGYADIVYRAMPKLKTVDTLMGILCLAGTALAIVTRQKLAGFKRGASDWLTLLYAYNAILSLFYPIAASAVVDVPGLLEESLTPGTIGGIIGCVVAVACNRIYYNKRASLFVN